MKACGGRLLVKFSGIRRLWTREEVEISSKNSIQSAYSYDKPLLIILHFNRTALC